MSILIFVVFSVMFQQSQWKIVSSGGPAPRYINQMAVKDGKVFLYGGKHSSNDGYDDLWEWSDGQWTLIGNGPQKIWDHSVVSMEHEGQLLIFGGRTMIGDEREDLSTSWIYEDKRWTSVEGKSPPARSSHSMSYLHKTKQAFLFGGRNKDEIHDDFWAFDGGQWKQIKVHGPSARYGHAMSYDHVSGKVYLFGGYNGVSLLDDFWSFDGEKWEEIKFNEGPSARTAHAFQFDHLGRAIVFGGWDDSQLVNGDLWVWSAGSWSQHNFDPGPQERLSTALTFIPTDNSFLLFGGSAGFGEDFHSESWGLTLSE